MSSITTTTTKNVANVKTKATPNSGRHIVKIPNSTELKLELKTLWNGSDAGGPHRKQLAKAAEKHEKWLDAIIGDVTAKMNEEVKGKVLMETMAEMEDYADGWWLLETCFNMMDEDADFSEFTDRLRDDGLDFIEDDNDLALVFDYLKWYRDDMCGAVDSRKVLQAVLELIEAGKADDAMVQLYNNVTGYANDHDFPDTELGKALNDPTQHRGVKLPVVKTSNGLLWCDILDALPMVVLYQGKRYDAGPFKMSQLPLDVLEDAVEDTRKPLKRSASAMDSNGARTPALKRSKSVVQKETKPKQINQFNQTTMSSSELGKLPPITDGLTRLLETPEPNGIHFIITDCAKGGFVFGNHTIEYQYDSEEFVTRCGRVANGEGEVLYGTVTLEDGKLRAPITEDALISFGKEEPIFPIGHYINIIKDQGGSLQAIE